MILKEGRLQHGCICDAGDRQTKPTRTDTINYVYDGMLAIQMRSSTTSSYTRGLDLSLSLQGAGGIGGLLAQSTPAHSYYHSDGNGNITYLMKADQSLGASYRYDDAYGNVVTTSGTLSNPFRFSSKEWLPRISAYYYGYRFYYPAIQRWLNRDPIGERGGLNLYGTVGNNPINFIDPFGLCDDPKTVDCFLRAQTAFTKSRNSFLFHAVAKHTLWTGVSTVATGIGIAAIYGTKGRVFVTPVGIVTEGTLLVNDLILGSLLMRELEEMSQESKVLLKNDLDECVKNSVDPDAQKEADKIYNRLSH